MLCCLNPACQNPSVHDSTKYCPDCGTPLLVLRNRYSPIKSLGGGGFGKTYLAEDVDKLREKCVIKQFAPQVQGTTGLQKATELFEQEARRLQLLGEHPQIPTLLAYFQEDSHLYLVQQFIDGQNLLQEMEQRGTFSEEKIRDLLQDLLNILQVVHQQKVIHRDIKPENIIRRGDGKIVLIDFGASKQVTQTVMAATQGTMIGSFGYAPLEQMQGGEAYPAGDLYGLGATCFHLLSGIHPWELWKRQGYGWVKNWRENLQQPVSEELGQILDTLLQEDYQQRYGSAQEVLQALNTPPMPAPQTQPITTPPSSPLVVPPTQTVISTPTPLPATVSVQVQATPTVASIKLPAKTKISTRNPLTQNPQRKKGLLVGAVIMLLGLVGTQIYGYVRDGSFPTDPIFLFQNKSFLNSSFSEKTLTGHSGYVVSVAISPDTKTLVSGSGDNTIKLWDLKTGKEIRTVPGHSDSINSVAISPDGKTLVSGSGYKDIKLWDLKTGKEIRTLTGHSDNVSSVAITPDGKTIVSGSWDNTIKLWDLETGKEIRTFRGHSDIRSIAISPDGKTLASGHVDNTVKLWNLETGEKTRTLTGHSGFVFSVAISPDGKTLVSGSADNTIRLWNLYTGEKIRTLEGHSNWVSSVAISPDGKTIVSGSRDKTIKLWNLETKEEIRTLKGHSNKVSSIAISPNSQIIVSGSDDETIKIWRLK
ncbi:serine/threonine-protein kinase [Calothrix sp. 336/3]|uniref:serine/threonine-protein kinase n=1 Tax=Calothrix sp. 336/3 TaxID=1337936 RepID=UPI0004E45839|nr:serine/threonine-protein kinase [Calothrix sp. 336/3]AKG23018.1 serine/threonine protein kinase [Calothrix sp. 336/3]